MGETQTNQTKWIITAVYTMIFVGVIVFLAPKIISFLLPFIFAYLISLAIVPTADFLQRRAKIPRKLGILFSMLLIISILVVFVINIVYQGVVALQSLSEQLPALLSGNYTPPGWVARLSDIYSKLPDDQQLFIDDIVKSVKDNLSQIIQPAAMATITAAKNIATRLPSIFIFTTVLVLATYFISNDTKKIKSHILRYLPKRIIQNLYVLKASISSAFGGYLKAQFLLMTITFIVLLIGLSALNIQSSFLIAFLISLVDALPILGTGIVLIPWAGIHLLQGNYKMAVWMFILYLSAVLVRQLLEPKIVGDKIGLHPLITLISMYIGLKLLGILGMIVGPIAAIILVSYLRAQKECR